MKKPDPTPLLHLGILDGLKMLNTVEKPNFFGELVALFSDSLPPVIFELKEEVERKNYKSVSRLAHRVKGSAGNMGAAKLASLAQQLKDLVDSHEPNPAEVKGYMQLIDEVFADSLRALRR
jgi:HPt (histidine-containing phosphotransfer) domain-containing protein